MSETAWDHCRELVRRYDKDRYLSALFAPPQHRDALMALYAFDVEIKRIADVVSDPMPGEIRLQWWMDALQGKEHGGSAGHPVAAALAETVACYNLPTKPLLDLVEAHTFDLYNDPMPLLTDLEGYTGETVSSVIQLAAIVLAGGRDPGTADAAGHAGVALGMTRILRALPWHTAKRQVYIPADVLGRHGTSSDEILKPGPCSRFQAALHEMREHVRHHLDRFRRAYDAARPNGVAAAFLEVGVVPSYLKAMEKTPSDPRRAQIEIPQWRRQWCLWRTARRLQQSA